MADLVRRKYRVPCGEEMLLGFDSEGYLTVDLRRRPETGIDIRDGDWFEFSEFVAYRDDQGRNGHLVHARRAQLVVDGPSVFFVFSDGQRIDTRNIVLPSAPVYIERIEGFDVH